MNNSSENKNSTIRISAKKKQPVIIQSAQRGSSVNLMPTVEIVESSVVFHFVTLAQMEKMHIHCRNVSTISFALTKGQDDFELRFSADSPQEIAGQLVVDDTIDLVDYVFDKINVNLLSSYDVSKVLLDGVDANLLEADINWRLAYLQQKAADLDGVARQGDNPEATNTAILEAVEANAGIPTLTIPDSTEAQELAPNVLYIFADRTSELTLTLGTPIVGIANEYHFFVVCGATAPTINFPAGITWNGGSAPTIAADKTYEVSILNNVAAYFEV